MVKKLLVAVAIAAPRVLMFVSDQARLGAQSGASVVISEFRTRGPIGGNDERAVQRAFEPRSQPTRFSAPAAISSSSTTPQRPATAAAWAAT
jgi:hypothetical protein